MPRENLNDLHAFLLVAEVKSFTRAAARLGIHAASGSKAL